MSNNTGDHLRAMLFKQLEALTDPAKDIDLKRAQITNETAQVIINSAKVEVDYVKAIGGAITLPYVEQQEGVTERPYREPQPVGAPAEPPTLPPAETQAAMGFGSKPKHPWKQDADRDTQRKADKAAGHTIAT